MKVSIVGAGNAATQLALGLKKAGHEIVQIYNRSSEAGKELATAVGAQFVSQPEAIVEADVYLIAVKDDVVGEVARSLPFHNKPVAHTSGFKSRDLLAVASDNFGVFYPLQTMTRLSRVDFKEVPILVEGNNESTLQRLTELARSLSDKVHAVDDDERRWIHVAAVFANNFTNHLWALSEQILQAQNIPFDILKPLIAKSVKSLEATSPSAIQTGPAARGDHRLVQEHLGLLQGDVRLHKLYRILSESIGKSVAKK